MQVGIKQRKSKQIKRSCKRICKLSLATKQLEETVESLHILPCHCIAHCLIAISTQSSLLHLKLR